MNLNRSQGPNTLHGFLMLLLSIFIGCGGVFSCQKRNGCTDPAANNYSAKAENDDNSCRYDNELFVGRWKVRDTLISNKDHKPEDEKLLTILSEQNNEASLKLIWKYTGGQYSDTLEAKLVPLAISIPEQPFGNRSFKGSIIYMFYSENPSPMIRLAYTLKDAYGNSVEIRGVGEKMN